MGTIKYKSTPSINEHPWKHWTLQEEEKLRLLYTFGSRSELILIFQRSWINIRRKAIVLGVRRQVAKTEAKLDNLLSESPEAMYWIGFLLADGNFVTQLNRLQVAVVDYDQEHLEKLAKFINATTRLYRCAGKPTANSRNQYWLAVSDKFIMPLLIKRFGFTNRKTYNPPSIENYGLGKDAIIALLVGIIDGDGSIYKRKSPRSDVSGNITCHSSWLANLLYLDSSIKQELNINNRSNPHIKGSGFATWSFGRGVLRLVKEHANRLNLPVMERKWNLV